MRAVVVKAYGSPDVLQLTEVEKPTPKDHELLVKVYATTVTVQDVRLRAFRVPPMFWIMGRLALGIRRPRKSILGAEFAGVVEAVGKAVTRFKPGDAVLALGGHDSGTYAEYTCLSEDANVVIKPANLSYEEAAAIPMGGLTALDFLRAGDIQLGQQVLVNGASGSVGTYAVQLAKHFGAEVTGVCSTANLDLVKSLGADHVIDYTQVDFTKNGKTYDIVFDAVGTTTFAQCKNALKPNGAYLHAVMVLSELKAPWYARTTGITVIGGTPEIPPDALELLANMVSSGEIKAVIDRCYPLEEIAEAHRYVDTNRKKGNVVIIVAAN